MRRGALNVVFAAHRLPSSQLPQLADDRVILNLEQVCAPLAWHVTDAATYRALLQSYPVIDYSERNRAWLSRELQVEAVAIGAVADDEDVPAVPRGAIACQ
jgi:hypothetical protein